MTNVYEATPGAQIPPRPAGLTELPLSAIQQRIWYLCTSYPGDTSPILYLAYRIRGPLAVDALVRAVGAVVDRHESLRARFLRRDGGAVQVVDPAAGLAVDRVDLTGLAPADAEERARELLHARTHALLDLERGPLVGSCLLRLGEDDLVWCMTMHHLVADGASAAIVCREVSALYRAFATGTEPTLAPLPIRYGDFAVWQQTSHDAEEADDLRYWRERLTGVPPLELPTDRPRPAEKGTRAAEVEHVIDGRLAGRIEELAGTYRCTLFMVLLAAVQALLAGWSGQRDFCVGTPIAGRTMVELEPLVGLFANTLPLRADLSGDPTFRELLARTRETAIDALDRQSVPFGRVVAELDLPRDPSRTQVFQVIYNLHTEIDTGGGLVLPGLAVQGFPVGRPQIIHDLVIDIWRRRDALSTAFRYDSALFEAATVATMARRYEELLRAVVDNPDARLSALERICR